MLKIENFIKIIKKNNVEIFILKKSDFNNENIKLFSSEIEYLSKIKNEIRKNEFLGVRYLRNYFYPNLEIHYFKSGKPFVKKNDIFISISHSKKYLGLAVAKYPIGLDMEECNERIDKIKSRFLNQEELSQLNSKSISQLTRAWCVKESLFKLNSRSGIDFKNELIIKELTNNIAKAEMLEKEGWISINLFIENIDDLVISVNFE
jgi:4'-phosphopantetheinyl transferase